MSSPFSELGARIVPTWTEQTVEQTVFSSFSPFGTFSVDSGYGSGGYGDLSYGIGTITQVTYSTTWTAFTDR